MKPTSPIIILILAIFTAMASVQAQSPREELKQMVEQLQANPTDNALREKIIKLAQEVKPAPAIPDKAIEYEGRAQFAFKSAKSEADFISAAREYENAIAAAPWVSGYYADLCTIYEKASRFEDAKRNCEFYLAGLTDPAQMTDVKRRIAGLTFGIEKSGAEKVLAAKQQADATRAANATARRENSIEGAWFAPGSPDFIVIVRRKGEVFEIKTNFSEVSFTISDVHATETTLQYKISGASPVDQYYDLRREGANLVGTIRNIRTTNRIAPVPDESVRAVRRPWKDLPSYLQRELEGIYPDD